MGAGGTLPGVVNRARLASSRVPWALALAAGLAGGCGTAATVHRRGGPAYRGRIVAGDGDAVYLRRGRSKTWAVPRSEIRRIDHPGPAGMWTGALLMAGSLTTMLSGGPSWNESKARFVIFGATGGGGAVAFVWGLVRWRRSIAAARSRGPLPPGIRPASAPGAGTPPPRPRGSTGLLPTPGGVETQGLPLPPFAPQPPPPISKRSATDR